MAERAVHVVIRGRVQGVGFRAWVEDEAEARALSGWVRNRREGTVEAVFAGDAAAVDAMVAACRVGPRAAAVDDVRVGDYAGPSLTGFTALATE
jgi:acylphosphatase